MRARPQESGTAKSADTAPERQGAVKTDTYYDIIDLPCPGSRKHTPMPLRERAAQFAPFAALTGFDEQLGEKARLTGCRPCVSDEEALKINEALSCLIGSGSRLSVKVTYFVPDGKKPGGAVMEREAEVRRVDAVARTLIFSDRSVVIIDDILTLDIM